jgi:RHS repeat-associated protein
VKATDKVSNTTATWTESGVVAVNKVVKYYTFGGQRVAMRRGDEVYYLSGDHLGSVSLTTDSAGNVQSESRYLPYGSLRWTNGAAVTDFGFTSQRRESGFGLYDYNARYYSPYLNRWASPDIIIPNPGNSQDFNRYSYPK